MPSKIIPERELPKEPERRGPLKKAKVADQPHQAADRDRINKAKPPGVPDAPLPKPRDRH